MTSAQIGEEPSPSKLDLIRRFLRASGIQDRIDSARILERYAMPGGSVFACAAHGDATFMGAHKAAFAALRAAYDKHRQVWQDEYERHINWEFTEEELREIVTFLEAPVGQHFLEGRWRMDAYIGTNTEDLVEEIVREAQAAVAAT